MSTIKDRATTKPPPTSWRRSKYFLGCFGCSGEKKQPPIDKVNSGSRRSWISKWNFSFRKSTTKTVPFDHTTVSRKSRSENLTPATSNTTWEIQVVEEDAKLTKNPVIVVDENHAPALSDEQKTRRKKWIDTVKRQNGVSRSRRKETKVTNTTPATAGLDSPVKKSVTITHPIVSSSLKPKTHPKSLPPPAPKEKKQPRAPPAADEGALEKTSPFDSIYGMSILLVTLVIMVLWGKLCAIICTCAWFLIAPRLVAGGKHSTAEKGRHGNLDLESVEYKKKVVLEGLLQRDHQNNGRRLYV